MKATSRRAAVLGVCALFASACSRQMDLEPYRSSSRLAIAVLGDSLALGFGAERPEDGFIFQAVRALERRYDVELFNAAIVSATVADTMRLEVPRLHDRRYDVGVICVGGNDVIDEVETVRFAMSYDALLHAVRRSATSLVCCGIPDVGLVRGLTVEQRRAARAVANEYNASISSLSLHARARFVDLMLANDSGHGSSVSSDGVHPSSHDYARMASRLAPALIAAARDRLRP